MPPLADLLARLRDVPEGSDYLNDAIAAILWPGKVSKSEFGDYFNRIDECLEIPDWTRSLDAAITLAQMPDWTGWFVAATADARAEARISLNGANNLYIARASTPALALCIAALTARQETSDAE